ncbi:MAG: type IV toxin-antitoxin system AbiEi family antitoxin domain-containing protein [Motilibacteraceae bacterium]
MTIDPLSGRVFLRREALASGITRQEADRLISTGEWQRVRHGSYCLRSAWERADGRQRHLMAAEAATRRLDGPPVLSHASAAMLWGFPDWGVDVSKVHVTRGDRWPGRQVAGVVHHSGQLPESEITRHRGLLVTTPARTVLDCLAGLSFDAGVVMTDAALHAGLVSPDELEALFEQRRDWPGSALLSRVLPFADGRAETPGESRLRVVYARRGLPIAVPQYAIPTRLGTFYVDLWIRELRLVSEFDGRRKYQPPQGAALTLASSAERAAVDAVIAEKRREDALREQGVEVVRVMWQELDDEAALEAQARAAGERAALRYGQAG